MDAVQISRELYGLSHFLLLYIRNILVRKLLVQSKPDKRTLTRQEKNVRLSGHGCIQMSHTGLAKNVRLSGLSAYAVSAYPVLTVHPFESVF